MDKQSRLTLQEIRGKAPEMKEHSLLPPNPESLLGATVAVRDGVLDRLHAKLSFLTVENPTDTAQGSVKRTVASRVQDVILELGERIRRYCIQEEGKGKQKRSTPTKYAELLVQALHSPDSLSPTLRRGLAEISSTVISEITPILRELHSYLAQDTVAPYLSAMQAGDLATPQGLLRFLRIGRLDDHDTYSFFGALDHLSLRVKDFPVFDLKDRPLANRLLVQDPLGKSSESYWKEKKRFYKQVYNRDMSGPDLIVHRSTSAAWELANQQVGRLENQASVLHLQLETEADKDKHAELEKRLEDTQLLQQSYADLATWIWDQAKGMEGMSEARLADHVAILTFTWGNSEEIFKIFNALEAVKQHNSEFYARLLGIRPGMTSKQSMRSDLFGNVLHIAFARSLHQAAVSDRPEASALRKRLEVLQTLDAVVAPLVYINEEQWEKIEEVLTPQEQGDTKGSGEAIARALMLVGISLESYTLRKMFESPDVIEREKVIESLRKATPREFIRLIKQVTKKYKPVPEDIKKVFEERGLTGEEVMTLIEFSKERDINPKPGDAIDSPSRILRVLHNNATYKILSNFDPFYRMFARLLWRTIPSEQILEGDEFFKYIEGEVEIHRLGRTDRKKLEELQKSLDDEAKTEQEFKGELEEIEKEKEKILPKQQHGLSARFQDLLSREGAVKDSINEHGQKIKEIEDEIAEKKEWSIRSILAILDAHPDITQEQWIEWWSKNSTKVETSEHKVGKQNIHGTGVEVEVTKRIHTDEARVKSMQTLFRHFTPQQIVESKSRIFVLFWHLFQTAHNLPIAYNYENARNFRIHILKETLGEERMSDFMNNGKEDAALQYKVLFKILSGKDFFSRYFIDGDFYKVDLRDFTKDMGLDSQKNFLAGLVKCLANETPMRYMTDTPIEWMRDLLNMSERFIPEDENYRILSRGSEEEYDRKRITNRLWSGMVYGVSSAFWPLNYVWEEKNPYGEKIKRYEAQTLRKIDGTWQIVTTNQLYI